MQIDSVMLEPAVREGVEGFQLLCVYGDGGTGVSGTLWKRGRECQAVRRKPPVPL